jgi:hypothetical protein
MVLVSRALENLHMYHTPKSETLFCHFPDILYNNDVRDT